MKNIKQFLNFLVFLLEDFLKTIKELTKKELLDIIDIIALGLVINSLSGLTHGFNLCDFVVLIISLYAALKARQGKKG